MPARLLTTTATRLALTLLSAVPASAQAPLPSMQALHEAALREREVAFGGALKEDDTAKLVAAFAKRYPGVAVKYTRRSTQPMVQLIEADRLAGRVSFDLVNITEPGDLVRWIGQGFLAAVPLPDRELMRPEAFDKDGHYYALGITPMLGIYNTDKLKPAEAPKSLKALLTEPQWIGKVVHTRPTRGGMASSSGSSSTRSWTSGSPRVRRPRSSTRSSGT